MRTNRVTVKRLRRIKAKWEKLRGLTRMQAAKVLGFPLGHGTMLHRLLQENNLLVDGTCKYPWHKMNFDLPSRTLDRIWNLPRDSAGYHRIKKRLPPPKWKFGRRWVEALEGCPPYEKFLEAVDVETRKAEEFHATSYAGSLGRPTLLGKPKP